jgi:hypothetical protein
MFKHGCFVDRMYKKIICDPVFMVWMLMKFMQEWQFSMMITVIQGKVHKLVERFRGKWTSVNDACTTWPSSSRLISVSQTNKKISVLWIASEICISHGKKQCTDSLRSIQNCYTCIMKFSQPIILRELYYTQSLGKHQICIHVFWWNQENL